MREGIELNRESKRELNQKGDLSKVFVLDTNVILHDHTSIYSFEENDIVIPIIVLEELDHFKRGSESKHFQAREFLRVLDELIGDDIFKDGVELGPGYGKLMVETSVEMSEDFKTILDRSVNDNKILATVQYVTTQNRAIDRDVIFVTKDINLRLKAKSIGLSAQDFKRDKVNDIGSIYSGIRSIVLSDPTPIDELYKSGLISWDRVLEYYSCEELQSGLGSASTAKGVEEEFDVVEFSDENCEKPKANEYVILKCESAGVITSYNRLTGNIEKITKRDAYGIHPRNSEQIVSLHALLNPDIKLVSITGKAGTGKTLLALAAALDSNKVYDQILLARPIVALSNRDLGFLPGDADQKVAPYMTPLFDNLSVIKRSFNPRSTEVQDIEQMQKDGRLVISPLAFIRGRSLSNTFFIIDEAQNLTPHEVKTIVTRAGEGTKIVFTGDIDQIDSPYLDQLSNGLTYLTDKMKDQTIFAHINLVKGERSHLAELASRLL